MTMRKILLTVTEQLHECLKHADANRKDGPVGVGPLIELLLRQSKPVKDAAVALGIEFQERPRMGRPRKKAE